MTVIELKEELRLTAAAMPSPTREICGVYIGDLLSRVMSGAKSGNAWITVMTNINVPAVAALTDAACIILADGVKPDCGVCEAADEHGINILLTDADTYSTAVAIHELLD